MIPEIGHYALVLALFLALVQSVIPLVGAARGDAAWMDVAKPAAIELFFTIAMNTLPRGGITVRKACGRTTSRSDWPKVRPMASRWR